MNKDMVRVENSQEIENGINQGIEIELDTGKVIKFSAFQDRNTVIDRIKQFMVKAKTRQTRQTEINVSMWFKL